MNETVLRLTGVARRYETGAGRLEVLRDVELSVARGELVALVGPSGSGKSTLLHVCGLLETPNAGRVTVNDTDTHQLDDARRTALRRGAIGFIYQFHHLLPEFSALENVMIPHRLNGQSRNAAALRARELLEMLGLADRQDHRPAELSGGEQQRVAIARALANRPRLLLADEPTGNLDPATSQRVFQELVRLARDEGLGALIATHNLDLAGNLDRCITIEQGRLVPYPV